MYVNRSKEVVIKADRWDKLDGLEAVSVLKSTKKERNCKIGRSKLCMANIKDKLKK